MSDELVRRVADVFSDRGPLARSLQSFEPRESQRAMAAAVAETLETGGVLLAEAGTGTGKTLAYLVPAILSGQRVLVSTGTKNLQEQIFSKDLPLLAQALSVRFRAALMKGRGNYLCLHRFEEFRKSPVVSRDVDRVHFALVESWSETTTTGDRGEVEELPDDLPFWPQISATAEHCLGSGVPAVWRLLRVEDASARGRGRRRHRQPPPAVRRRRHTASRLRGGDSRVPGRDRRRGASARRRRHADTSAWP